MITDNWRSRYSDQASIVVSPEFALLVKVHGEIAKATFHFFESKGFCYVPVPGTTGSSSSPTEPGSDSAPVIIEIEGKRNMLTDSAQFHLEYACRSYQEGCFYYGHSYRNEDPDERHLAQFTHAEAEMAGTLEDVKMLVEDYIRYLTESIWENLADCLFKIPGIQDRIDNLLKSKYHFQSISFDDAYKFFKKNEGLFKYCDNGGYRLTAEGERNLLDNFGEFIWIEKWDKMAVPFYQATDDKTGIALNADLLFGMGSARLS